MNRADRTAVGAAIGFCVVLAPGMLLAAFALLYALVAAVVGAGLGALIGFAIR
jgi:hypothetical protein